MKWFLTQVKHWTVIALAAYTVLVAAQVADRDYKLDKTQAKMNYQYLKMEDFRFRAQYPPIKNKPIAYECYE